MNTLCFALCCFLSMVVLPQTALAKPRNGTCGKKEEYRTCGSKCQGSCKTLNNQICLAVCEEGCFCIRGYVRNAVGKCIPADNCPPESCPVNEVPSSCANPCNDCFTQGKCNFLVCNAGCDCKKGYFRDFDNSNGACIPEASCPPVSETCGENAEYTMCGSACQQECETLNNQVCLAVCEEGCFCIRGYARDANGKCIPANECPPESCPVNEVPSSCVNPCNDCFTQGNCDFLVCNAGCDCKKGYFRDFDNSNGACIPEASCPPVSEVEITEESK